jgi:hypothetical protein
MYRNAQPAAGQRQNGEDGAMKLSEAIRLGAMMKPQGREMLGRSGSTCAIGAALDAVGKLAGKELCIDGGAAELWPILDEFVPTPESAAAAKRKLSIRAPAQSYCVMSLVFFMNDEMYLTREEIADWVEGIERSLEPQSPAAGEPETVVSVSVVNDAQTLISVSK